MIKTSKRLARNFCLYLRRKLLFNAITYQIYCQHIQRDKELQQAILAAQRMHDAMRRYRESIDLHLKNAELKRQGGNSYVN